MRPTRLEAIRALDAFASERASRSSAAATESSLPAEPVAAECAPFETVTAAAASSPLSGTFPSRAADRVTHIPAHVAQHQTPIWRLSALVSYRNPPVACWR